MESFLTHNINQGMLLFLHSKKEESLSYFKEIKMKRYLFPANVIPLVSLYPDLFKELAKNNLIIDTDFFDISDHFLLPVSYNFLLDKDNVDFFVNKCPDALLDYVSYGLSFSEDEKDFLNMYSTLNNTIVKNIKEQVEISSFNINKQDIRKKLQYFESQLTDRLKIDWESQLEK